MRRKPGTDTKFPAQFAGNWLSVPGFAPRENATPGRVPPEPLGTRAAARKAGGTSRVVLSLCTHRGNTMQATKVGIREFRENLSSFLESKTPIAITRHGATIGIYLPTRPKPSQADLEALRAAGEKLDAMIAAAGTNEEELMEDFKRLRQESRKRKV